ncbi:hypothetical protein [Nocardia inohanensis]|uniref:hypothetical protein n=1 Tax=Nocardia inohanensis TaxID=209246 RepID=UPI00082B1C1C|nr:hypothetical protein [Nocardia inohanensis]
MHMFSEFLRNTLARCVLPLALGAILISLPVAMPAAHADADYGGGCALYTGNRAATIDALRFRCSNAQQDNIFRDAPRGAVPMGIKDGWVARGDVKPIAPALWIGKTFFTGPDGGYLLNRLTPAGIEAIPADVYSGAAILDGGPVWALNYAPSPFPQVYDEIREVTPGVWFGYSWWRDGGGISQMLMFILA